MYVHYFASNYIHTLCEHCTHNTFVTGFTKRGLIHASNFSNLRLCYLAYIWPTALKFGSRTFLLLLLYDNKFQLNSLLIHKVMPRQSCTIRCVYKTPFHKSGHIYVQLQSHLQMSLQNHIHIQYPCNPVTSYVHSGYTGIVDIAHPITDHTFIFWTLNNKYSIITHV